MKRIVFCKKVENEFQKSSDIDALFEVFKFENNKPKILELAQKSYDSECFHKMVEFIVDKFPEECFVAYKTKINNLLEVADTCKYEIICKDLLKMRKIGLSDEFKLYLNNIKTNFYRRRRLMEEIDRYKL